MAKPFLVKIPLCCLFLFSLCAGCEHQSEPVQKAVLPVVKYLEVRPETIELNFRFPGRIAAFTAAEVRPQVTGIIKERIFEEGAYVQEGQTLYRLEDERYLAAFKNAQATLQKAEFTAEHAAATARRKRSLLASRAVSRQDYEDAHMVERNAVAEVEAARQNLEKAAIDLHYTEITAPVSGRIGRSSVTPGALVTQNQTEPLAIIRQIDKVYVDMSQPGTEHLAMCREIAAGRISLSENNSVRLWLQLEDGSPYTRVGSTTQEKNMGKSELF